MSSSRALAKAALRDLHETRAAYAADREPGDGPFSTVYMVVLAVVLAAAIGGQGLWRLGLAVTGSQTGAPALAGTLGAAAWLAVAGSALWLAAWAGPIGADPARRTWLLSSPGDRRTLLTTRYALTAVVALAAGALGGVLALVPVATSGVSGAEGAGAAALGAGATLVVTGVLALAQTGRSPRRTSTLGRVGGMALLASSSLVAALGVLGVAPGDGVGQAPAPALGGALLLAGLALVGAAWARAARVPMAELIRGGRASGAAATSVLMLDASALGETRSVLRRRGSRTRGVGRGAAALVPAAVRSGFRRPGPLLAAVCALPWAALLAGRVPTVALTLLVLAATLAPALVAGGMLRGWFRSTGLRRALPHAEPVTAAALAVPVALVALVVAVPLVLAARLPWWAAGAFVLVALATAVRTLEAPDLAAVGPLVATPAGALPLGLAARLLNGPDVALVAAVPLLVGAAAPVALLWPAAVFAWLWQRTVPTTA